MEKNERRCPSCGGKLKDGTMWEEGEAYSIKQCVDCMWWGK